MTDEAVIDEWVAIRALRPISPSEHRAKWEARYEAARVEWEESPECQAFWEKWHSDFAVRASESR